MSQMDKLPSLHNIKKRAEKMQKDCQKWDALISITDDLISQLEGEIRQQPNYIYRITKANNSLKLSN